MMSKCTEITTIFFDLDDTLYPRSSGIWPTIGRRIEDFMHLRLGLSREEIPGLRRSLFNTYGTTLRGLQIDYQIDAHEYLAYVHDIPLDQYLDPNPALRDMVARYPQRKFIFTNADSKHARRVIQALGLDGCFDGIIDILDISPFCKPMPEAFRTALHLVGNPPPETCAFVDDNPANLQAAVEIGFKSVCVGRTDHQSEQICCIPELLDLPTVIPVDGKGLA